VVHPDARGSYLTGIECDGATYHRSATARDRDMLREQVLRGLGWEILRVWSTDWWVDKAGTLAKLDAKLRGLLETSRAKRADEAERQAASDAAEAAITKAREEAASSAAAPSALAGQEGGVDTEPALDAKARQHERPAEQQETEVYARNVVDDLPAATGVFVESDPSTAVDAVNADAFFDSAYDTVLRRMIAHVVEVEGPVLDTVLARRIARAHGWQRTGSRIQERVESLAATAIRTIEENVGTFYWAAARGPEIQIVFRRSADESVRAVDEICMPELVDLARFVLASGKTGNVVIVAMARELGLQRTGASIRQRLERAMGLAER
jgi:hypothetical protein